MTYPKKNVIAGLLLTVTVAMGVGPVASAEAYNPNANWAYGPNQYQIQTMSYEHMQLMVQLLTQLRTRLQQLLQLQAYTYSTGDSEVEIATRAATEIDDTEATLHGRVVDFNRSDYADVWFEYSEDRTDLDQDTNKQRLYEDGSSYFYSRVDDLDDRTDYYFRAVGEDEDNVRDYGAIYHFVTDSADSTSDLEHPTITTQSAMSIRETSAELRGYVDMNDFNNGEVFFVYGEDQNQVEDIEDDYYSYSDVDEDGRDLQKERVDSDLDSTGSYIEKVTSLDNDTRYYFSICVGYEDEDNDEVLKCGSVRAFTTDN